MNSNELRKVQGTDPAALQKEIYQMSKELMRLKKKINAESRYKYTVNVEEQLRRRKQYLDQVTELNILVDQLKNQEKMSFREKSIMTQIEEFLSPPKKTRGLEQNSYEKMKKKTEKLLQIYSS